MTSPSPRSSTLEAIYLARPPASGRGGGGTNRSARGHGAVHGAHGAHGVHAAPAPSHATPSALAAPRARSRPVSALASHRAQPPPPLQPSHSHSSAGLILSHLGTLSSPPAAPLGVSSGPLSPTRVGASQFASLLREMQALVSDVLQAPPIAAPSSPQGGTGPQSKTRPSSAAVRGRSAERRQPDPAAYMSRKGATALRRMAERGERDWSTGMYAFTRAREEAKEQQQQSASPLAASLASAAATQPLLQSAPPYWASFSTAQLQRELATALDTIRLHERSAAQQTEFYSSRIESLEAEAEKWRHLAEMYRAQLLSGPALPTAPVAASAASTVPSSLPIAKSPKSSRAPTPASSSARAASSHASTPTGRASAASASNQDDYSDEDNERTPSRAAPARSVEPADEYEEEAFADDDAASRPSARPAQSPSPAPSLSSPKPGALKTPKSGRSDLSDTASGRGGSGLASVHGAGHVKNKPSVTFVGVSMEESLDDASSAAVPHAPNDGSETERSHATRSAPGSGRSVVSDSGSHRRGVSSGELSDASARALAQLASEKARRAAEIDAMFPSDEDDETTVARHRTQKAVSGKHGRQMDEEVDEEEEEVEFEEEEDAVRVPAPKPVPSSSARSQRGASPPSASPRLSPSLRQSSTAPPAAAFPSSASTSGSAPSGVSMRLARPESASREGRGSRPSSASSRENSRPSSASRTRPNPLPLPLPVPGHRPPTHPHVRDRDRPPSASSASAVVPSASAGSASGVGALDSERGMFVVVRDEDEDGASDGSELYGSDYIDEEEDSFHVQQAE